MELLERESLLDALGAVLRDVAAGRGRVALVSGEAGIGKTSLVARFTAMSAGARVVWGACDPLFTPRPLGPLHDMAPALGGRLVDLLERDAPRAALFAAFLDALHEADRPSIAVFEDLHWADEATLDLVKFVVRRMPRTPALLVLTYRDDEVGPRHPLRAVLGDVATSGGLHRFVVPPLSPGAVRALADGRGVDAAALHRHTGGNPFFVTEALATGQGIPPTVRDAVLARASRLSAAGRTVLDAVAVIGGRVNPTLLAQVVGDAAAAADDGIAVGTLTAHGDLIAFRHELARDAIAQAIAPARRRALHRRVLEALAAAPDGARDVAQLAHHAEGADDADAVRTYAPQAARRAAAVGSHREAAAQWARALRFSRGAPAHERIGLLEAYAEESATLDHLGDAVAARREAIDLAGASGDRRREGENLAAVAWPLVRAARNAEAEQASRRAIDVLESVAPSRALATAYRIQAHLRMLDRDRTAAVRWGRRAIALAERFDDVETVAASHMIVGTAMLVAGDERGLPSLERSLELSRGAGLHALVALTLLNIGSSYGEQYRFDAADRSLSEGIAYAVERDLDHTTHYMRAWLAIVRLYQGRWGDAGEIASAVTGLTDVSAVSRIMALVALGRLRTRRGDPGAGALLDEALTLAAQTATLQRLAPVRAARAEAAWLAGDGARTVEEARAVWDLAMRHRHAWHAGELAYWRWRAGDAVRVPPFAARPFALQIRGAWREAAAAWERRGCPYERARAWADGDEAARLAALDAFDRLGARPAADLVRRALRAEGARKIPRGPRPATRAHPFRLTAREREILESLARGLSNSEIGAELRVSAKTVDHHVSAVLGKLGVSSRRQAARVAREHGLVGHGREPVTPT